MMKPILPKGTITLKCFDGSNSFQSILTSPGTTILVIPSASRSGNEITKNAKFPPASNHSSDLSLATKNCMGRNLNNIMIKDSNSIVSSSLRSDDKCGMHDSIIENNGKGGKRKTSNTIIQVTTLDRRNSAKEIENSKTAFESKICDGYSFNTPRQLEVNTKSANLTGITEESFLSSNTCSPLKQGNELIYEQMFYKSIDQNSSKMEYAPKIHDEMETNLNISSPPSYESYISNASINGFIQKDEGTTKFNSPSVCNKARTSLPPSYKQSSQGNCSRICLSPCPKSNSFSTKKMESISSVTYYTQEHLQLKETDNRTNVAFNDQISSSNNDYYTSTSVAKDYYNLEQKADSSLNYKYNCFKASRPYEDVDSNSWFYPSHCDDEPQDYSYSSVINSAVPKEATENLDYVGSFVRDAKAQIIIKEKIESSYEDRKKVATDLLSSFGSETERKKGLKENFWIVEDEPLQESVFTKNENPREASNRCLKSPSLKLKKLKEFVCHICGKTLKGRSGLRSHVHLHLNVKPYECGYCLKRFTQSSVLKNHLRIHTGETPYRCTICPLPFKTLSALRKHTTKHSKLRPFKCLVCSRAFKNKTHLQNHIKLHLTGPHLCRICNNLFDSRRALASHIQRKHKYQRKYCCTICNRSYGLKRLLDQHMNVHSNESKHSCYVCGLSYVWRSGLAAHLRTHSFKIQCEVCGQKFISLRKLEKHRNRHSEPFPHKCSKCDKQFKFSYLLKKHFAKHKDNLFCAECQTGFTTKTRMKKHMDMHSQEQK